MKWTLVFLLPFFSLAAIAQSGPDYQVTLAGIGPVKIDVAKSELEKILNQPLPVSDMNIDNHGFDTVRVSYRDIPLEIVFFKKYIEDNNYETAVYAVGSSSQLLKTKSGIAIGDDKLKVVSTYTDYFLEVTPYYEIDPAGNGARSKTRSTITLHSDTTNSIIIFLFEKGKLVSFTVSIFEGC